jgi:hypothetical protein
VPSLAVTESHTASAVYDSHVMFVVPSNRADEDNDFTSFRSLAV